MTSPPHDKCLLDTKCHIVIDEGQQDKRGKRYRVKSNKKRTGKQNPYRLCCRLYSAVVVVEIKSIIHLIQFSYRGV